MQELLRASYLQLGRAHPCVKEKDHKRFLSNSGVKGFCVCDTMVADRVAQVDVKSVGVEQGAGEVYEPLSLAVHGEATTERCCEGSVSGNMER